MSHIQNDFYLRLQIDFRFDEGSALSSSELEIDMSDQVF